MILDFWPVRLNLHTMTSSKYEWEPNNQDKSISKKKEVMSGEIEDRWVWELKNNTGFGGRLKMG